MLYFPREKYKWETISSSTWRSFVQWQPCARNDRLALGRPHMGLISPHLSFILSWQNNGCLWRASYPLLSPSPCPKASKFTQSNTPRPCAKGQITFSCTHIGLWLNPTSVMSLVYQLMFSSLSLPTNYTEIKKGLDRKTKTRTCTKLKQKVKPQYSLLRKWWDIL